MSETSQPHDRNLDRMLFFSDAVFAIVLTLLVLELRPPAQEGGEAELAHALAGMTERFIAFFASFALIGLWWMIHMRTTRRLRQFDGPTAVANLVFLASIALVPFAQALFGEHFESLLALGVYWAVSLGCALTMTVLFLVSSRGGGRLVGGLTLREWWGRLLQSLSPAVAFIFGIWAALAGQAMLARFCWVLIFPVQMIGRMVGGQPTESALAPSTSPDAEAGAKR